LQQDESGEGASVFAIDEDEGMSDWGSWLAPTRSASMAGAWTACALQSPNVAARLVGLRFFFDWRGLRDGRGKRLISSDAFCIHDGRKKCRSIGYSSGRHPTRRLPAVVTDPRPETRDLRRPEPRILGGLALWARPYD